MENKKFVIHSNFKPSGDQPNAIKELVEGINEGKKYQVLLGATGTGKTFTMANIIEKVQKPTLILVHNKTLAGQLYAEFKELFPENRVEYFVSNFDFYQPEAYIPSSDTYIGKEAMMNDELEMMRVSAINSVMSRRDTIVVASVASIYGLTDPDEYKKLIFDIRVGEKLDRREFFTKLINQSYKRNDIDLQPGRFRVHGDLIDIMPADSSEWYIRIDCFDEDIEHIAKVNYLTGEVIERYKTFNLFPAYDHASTSENILRACETIYEELLERMKFYEAEGKPLEKERIEMRTKQDLASLREFGMCPGIENYSRHIDHRKPGEKPFCLMDYFADDYLLFVDESHVTLPQIRGMFNGDRSRKLNLVEYGFRLPSALDNRPLNFDEFQGEINQVICTSATPGDFELEKTGGKFVEQIIRPTGLLDPEIEVRQTLGQIDDLMFEIKERIKRNERVMIVTLTIKMAEDLTAFLKEHDIKTVYMHSECKTLERSEIIYQLRKGKYDVLVGINLLREGLDIPEVSLIAILDADKEGFLRSTRSLIQVVGRAARNVNGKAIMYADTITDSMKECISETNRRRAIQQKYNDEMGIIPETIIKPIQAPLHSIETEAETYDISKAKLTKKELDAKIKEVEKAMHKAAKEFDFEKAIELRDILFELKAERN
ncbi:MAG: excinuclease ABC subunit UvrB [Bacilli bacterium]|nr:excinuclease ABC subunit UvrB [Bacilli bacterium]